LSRNSIATLLLIRYPESKGKRAKLLGQRKLPQTATLCAPLAKLLARGLSTPRRRAPASCTYSSNEATSQHLRFISPPSLKYLLPGETRPAPKRLRSFQPLYVLLLANFYAARKGSTRNCSRYIFLNLEF
jgi:hypothetical protein